MGAPNISMMATGDIYPSRFVTPTAGGDRAVSQSTTGDLPIGISAEYAHYAPYGSSNSTLAASSAQSIAFYGIGEVCPLEIAGTVQTGDFLKSDTSGKGVVGTLQTDKIGARALEAGTSGSIIRVYVQTNA